MVGGKHCDQLCSLFLLGRPWLILVRYSVAWLGDEGLESVLWLEMEE